MASPSTLIVAIAHLLFLCTHGFTTDLIPINSPLSPFYNPSSTHHDRLQSSTLRSFNRIKHFKTNAEAPLMSVPILGQYIMRASLGTPPVDILGSISTVHELSWTTCLPCTNCFISPLPLFDPSRSSSYKNVSCGSDPCNELADHSCSKESTCEYDFSPVIAGDLATETLIIGGGSIKNQSLPNFVFGCGHSSRLYPIIGYGIIGLGPGNLSLVSQLGAGDRKFSYCLSQEDRNTSKISFGSDAVVSGSGVVTTPFVIREELGQGNLYFVTLEAISVGSRRIEFVAQKEDTRKNEDEGNIVIDQGISSMFLPRDVYEEFVLALKNAINRPIVRGPPGEESRLCYKIDHQKKGPQFDINVTAHFKGADVELLQPNIFEFGYTGYDILCLAVEPYRYHISFHYPVFGTLAQMNMLVGYDLDARVVSFKRTDDCIDHH